MIVVDQRNVIFSSMIADLFNSIPRRLIAAYFGILILDGVFAFLSVLLLLPIAVELSPAIIPGNQEPANWLLDRIAGIVGERLNLPVLLALFIFVNCAKAVTDLLTRFLILRIKYNRIKSISLDTAASFLKARNDYINALDRGRFLNTMTRETERYGDALGMLFDFFSAFFQLTIYIVAPIIFTPELSIITLGLLLLISSPFLFITKKARRWGAQATESANKCMKSKFEIINHGQFFKKFDVAPEELKDYGAHLERHIGAVIKFSILSGAIPVSLQPLSIIAAVAAMGVSYLQEGTMFLAAPILWSVLRIYPLLSKILSLNFVLHTLAPSKNQVDTLIDDLKQHRESEGLRDLNNISKVTFHNVSFSYDDERQIVDQLSFEARCGEILLIKGSSGVGKSTILSLMQGHIVPHSGSVLFDDVSLTELSRSSISRHLCCLEQDICLLNRSIKKNICIGGTFDDAEVLKAVRAASAYDLIASLPQRTETLIEEDGVNFSGGERQRLGIARTLIRESTILVLDEPTSALDSKTSKKIIDNISALKADRIIVIVSHDAKFDEIADKVIELK